MSRFAAVLRHKRFIVSSSHITSLSVTPSLSRSSLDPAMPSMTATTTKMTATIRLIVMLSLLLTPALSAEIYSLEEVHGLSDFLRGGDKRLIREKPHQGSFLRTGSFCEGMNNLIATLKDSNDPKVKYYSADAITTCLLHRPDNQNAAGINPVFHETVIDYLREEPHVAAELIWAATENNNINLSGFIDKDAVEELFRVMQYYENSVGAMWSAAALMNMSTSYCGKGGPCIWKWNTNDKLRTTHEIEVDGLVARLHISGLEGIWDLLLDQVCSSVAFEGIHGVVFPSQAIRPTDVSSLVPWAMAGLIKTLALRNKSHKHLESTVPCLCILSKSDDELERRSAQEALYNLGREGACHTEDARVGVCIDMPFQTKDGIKCSALTTAEDCRMNPVDKETDLTSKKACCICGGGDELANVAFVEATDAEDL